MTYYTDPAKNTFTYNLSVAHDMCAAEQFATKQAHKDCLTRIQRAYECLRDKRDLKALEAAGFNWFDIPMELRHCRHEKHFDLFCAALGNDDAGRVFYLQREQQRIKAMPIVKPTPKPKAAAPKTERSATHVGTCQICGRKHKVDVKTGRIASHGYTKDFGFHNNQCFGSNSMPYETHKDALIQYIRRLEKKWAVISNKVNLLSDHERMKMEAEEGVLMNAISRLLDRLETWRANQPLTPVEELV